MSQTVRLAVAPIAWKNDDLPDLGAETTLETVFAESREAGFTGTEKGGSFPDDPALLKPLLDAEGLTLASGWWSGELLLNDPVAEFDRMGGHIDVLLKCGSEVCVFAETSNSTQTKRDLALADRPVLSDDDVKRYGEHLSALADRMKAAGLPMSYHHHMGTIIEAEDDVHRLMEATDTSVGLLFDTGHLHLAGCDDIMRVMTRWTDRINHIHVKDVRDDVAARVRAERLSFLDGVFLGMFTVPGDGAINFQPVCDQIAKTGYSDWVVVEAEQDPAKANPLEYSKLGGQTIRDCLAKAGVGVRA